MRCIEPVRKRTAVLLSLSLPALLDRGQGLEHVAVACLTWQLAKSRCIAPLRVAAVALARIWIYGHRA